MNDRIFICAFSCEIYFVVLIIMFKFNKTYFIRKPIFLCLLFKFDKTSIKFTHCYSPLLFYKRQSASPAMRCILRTML